MGDHLRQHDRVSVEEEADEKRMQALLVAGTTPGVTHLIAAGGASDEAD